MKKIIIKSLFGLFTILAIAFIFTPNTAHAARFKDIPVTLTQPDNTTIQSYISGDEFFNYYHDKDGNIIVQDSDTGFYTYATIKDGKIKATSNNAQAKGYKGKSIKYKDLDLENNPQFFLRDQKTFDKKISANALQAVQSSFNTGVLNNIAIFIRFSDEAEFLTPAESTSLINMFNAPDRSLKSYLTALSENALTVNTSFYPKNAGGQVYSYQDSHPRGYYMPYNAVTNPIGSEDANVTFERGLQMLRNAVDAVDGQVPAALNIDKDNDGNVDNVCFVVSGRPGAWASFLWPHMYYGFNGCSINGKVVLTYNMQLEYFLTDIDKEAVLCHEMLHTLGFPDLYRYSYDGDTMGRWDVMNITTTPTQYSNTYSKNFHGQWTHSGAIGVISQNGHYTLRPVTSNTGTVAYKIPLPFSDKQYVMLEYRKKTAGTYESEIPGSGLIIYRIDETMQKNGDMYGPPDEVYVFRPGETGAGKGDGSLAEAFLSAESGRTSFGSQDLSDYDYVPGSIYYQNGTNTGIEIKNVSTAGTTISFDIEINSSPIGGTGIGSGTGSDPYIIRDAQELDMIRGYKRTGWNMNKYYRLGADIDLSDYGIWESIGSWREPFIGSLDGAGYKIYGMETTSHAIDEYIGLFAVIGFDGKVTNLSIVDCDAYGSDNPDEVLAAAAGGVTGVNMGVISNCYVQGKIHGANYAGGIAGHNGAQDAGSLPFGIIQYDQSGAEPGTIKRYQPEALDEKALSALQIPKTASRTYYGEISNCYADVEVTGVRIFIGVGYAGGLAGCNERYGLIQNSAANVHGTAVDAVGGIAASNEGYITDTYASGRLETVYNGGSIVGCFYSHSGTVNNSLGCCDIKDLSGCGGIIGRMTVEHSWNALYYDKQLCGKNPNDIGSVLTTAQLTNGLLPSGLSSTYWEAKAGYYPRLKLLRNYLSVGEIPVYWGGNITLRAIQQDFTLPDRDWSGHNVSWYSDNPSVISITGKTAHKAGNGNAIISATVNDGVKTVSKEFHAAVAKPVTSITLDKTFVYIEPKGTGKITATVLPADTPYQKTYWYSSILNIINVDGDGNLKNVDVFEDPTIIRAIAMDGSGIYADCIVKIPTTNAFLSSLAVIDVHNQYDYMEGFAFDKLNYTINVPYKTNIVEIFSAPQNTYANVESGNGFHTLNVGLNSIKVVVKADKGVSLTYTINITREKDPVSAPSSVTAVSANYNSIKISWGNVSGVSGYKVHRSTSSNGSYSLIAATSSTSYTDTGLSTGKTYYYKICSYINAGSSKVTGDFSSTVSAAPVLSQVTGAKASMYYPTSIKVSWIAVPGRSGYVVERSTSPTSGFKVIKSTSSTYYKNTGLTTNTKYYYRVRAYRNVGRTKVYGAYSAVVSDTPRLAKVSGVKASVSSATKVKIRWSSLSGESGYEILRSTSPTSGFTAVDTTTRTYWYNSNVTPNTTYYYKVRAYKTISKVKRYGEESAVVSVRPVFATVSEAKASMYSVTSNKISWSSVSSRKGYEIWRSESPDSGYAYVTSTTSTYYINKSLVPNKTYYYQIRAYVMVGKTKYFSGYSNTTSAMPVFGSVSRVTASVSSPTSSKLTWKSVSGRSGYEILRSTSLGGTYSVINSTTKTHYYDKKCVPNTTYYYKVRAYVTVKGVRCYSSESAAVSVTPALIAVTGAKAARSSSTKIKLTWKSVSGSTGYEILRCDSVDGTYTVIKTTTSTYYYNSGLTTGKTYYYKIRAYKEIKGVKYYGGESSVVFVTP